MCHTINMERERDSKEMTLRPRTDAEMVAAFNAVRFLLGYHKEEEAQ
jgi:hypothetical protein